MLSELRLAVPTAKIWSAHWADSAHCVFIVPFRGVKQDFPDYTVYLLPLLTWSKINQLFYSPSLRASADLLAVARHLASFASVLWVELHSPMTLRNKWSRGLMQTGM